MSTIYIVSFVCLEVQDFFSSSLARQCIPATLFRLTRVSPLPKVFFPLFSLVSVVQQSSRSLNTPSFVTLSAHMYVYIPAPLLEALPFILSYPRIWYQWRLRNNDVLPDVSMGPYSGSCHATFSLQHSPWDLKAIFHFSTLQVITYKVLCFHLKLHTSS